MCVGSRPAVHPHLCSVRALCQGGLLATTLQRERSDNAARGVVSRF